ncbi:MAG: hypothetical protein R2860_12905 [Desulfobacterales bacterium]
MDRSTLFTVSALMESISKKVPSIYITASIIATLQRCAAFIMYWASVLPYPKSVIFWVIYWVSQNQIIPPETLF